MLPGRRFLFREPRDLPALLREYRPYGSPREGFHRGAWPRPMGCQHSSSTTCSAPTSRRLPPPPLTASTANGLRAGPAASPVCLRGRTHFLDEVNENGSGIDSVGVPIQIEGFCGNAPATSPAYNSRRYRRPADIRTQCNTHLEVDHTVARGPGSISTLPCGTPVFIDGLGRRFVEDRGGGVATDQLDNYKGVGAAVCQGWANPRRKTVKLF